MKRLLVVLSVVLMVVLSSGCMMGYTYSPQNITESVKLIEATEGSGCTYFRGNSRPYADVSFMTIHAYGKNAPKYDQCLAIIPPEVRLHMFTPQGND